MRTSWAKRSGGRSRARRFPVIADAAVDLAFGTGALKITPAHDKLDFEIGQRHGLGVVDALHPNGTINCPAVPELNGLDRFAARKKAAEMLAEAGPAHEGGSRTKTTWA